MSLTGTVVDFPSAGSSGNFQQREPGHSADTLDCAPLAGDYVAMGLTVMSVLSQFIPPYVFFIGAVRALMFLI